MLIILFRCVSDRVWLMLQPLRARGPDPITPRLSDGLLLALELLRLPRIIPAKALRSKNGWIDIWLTYSSGAIQSTAQAAHLEEERAGVSTVVGCAPHPAPSQGLRRPCPGTHLLQTSCMPYPCQVLSQETVHQDPPSTLVP